MPVMSAGSTLRAVDASAVDALLEVAGPQCTAPIAAVELRALGGSLARPAALPNAVGGRDAGWNLFVAAAPVPGLAPDIRRDHVRSVLRAAPPWRGPANLANFIGRANEPNDLRASWSAEQNARLDAVRRAADPDGLFPFAAARPS